MRLSASDFAIVVALVHAGLAASLLCIGWLAADFTIVGLLLLSLDFPLSPGFYALGDTLFASDPASINPDLRATFLIAGLHIVAGSIWYYALTLVVLRLVRAVKTKIFNR